MSEFGWANVKGKLAKGENGSVQINDGVGALTGSEKLVYDISNNKLTLTGSLEVSGSIYANELVVDVTNRNVVNISATGSTTFGDTTDDVHTLVGKTVLTGAAGSTLIYELSATGYNLLANTQKAAVTTDGGKYYLSSSNPTHRGILNVTDITDNVSFDRAVGAALVVSGAAVFKDPVSMQGGIYGASPINVFAPLKFSREDLADDVAPESELTIQDGKFVGSVIISSSFDNHGLFLQGAGRIVMSTLTGSDGTSANATTEPAPEIIMSNKNALPFSNAALDFRNLQDVQPSDHIFFKHRNHSSSRYRTGQIQFRAEIPVLTGSNTASAAQYQLSNIDNIHLIADTDLRRHSTLFRVSTLEMNVDKDYKYHSVFSSSLTNESGSKYPIIHTSSPLYTASKDNFTADVFNTLLVGSWANPGQDNRYEVNRGIGVYGSIYPFPINLTSVSGGNFDAKDMTLGHPNTRWGDFYIHDNRYIRWGQKADGYVNHYKTNPLTASARNESGSVTLGYSTSSNMLELSGDSFYAKNGLNVGAGDYINFGGVSGSSGYGFRDNSGTLQFKSSGGNWADIGSGGGGGGTIGAAEDGDYTDGLYTDFATGTLVGVAVDRFNEVLKILAPSPAPSVRSINHDQSVGASAKLSFDASNAITGYTASATAAGFTAVTRNNAYTASVSGSNIRLGVYNGQELTGTVNNNVGVSVSNGNLAFASGAFGNGDTGTLKLELNGTVIHSVNLASFTGTGQPATGSGTSLTNGSGFVNVSIASSSLDGNGAEWYIFKYRTAKYKIEANDQKNGWNYLRVIHTVGSTDSSTNYIEWMNDPTGASQALAVVNPRIDSVTLTGSKYISGVEYNTGLTASYKAHITNMYRNVYPAGSNTITFSPSNAAAISAQSVPAISSGNETNIVPITASVVYNSNFLLNGTISTSLSATHPLKSNLSSTGSASITGMLIDARSDANSNLSETFEDEDFRITSGAYANQAAVTAGAATWSSQNHMTSSGAAGHTDGLLLYNRRLYSPKASDIPNNGNFTALANVESGQPNYSGVTGLRTFYRKVQNTSGATIRDVKISMNKFKSIVRDNAPDDNDIDIYIKVPGQTGFMKTWSNFVYGSVSDNDGALINGADDNSNISNSAAAVLAVHCLTFGTASVANNEYFVVKVVANSSWGGYIDDMTFQLGASDVSAPTEAPVLDDVDVNDTGVTTKLSFGSSNAVTGYTVVNGSSIGSSDVNSNGVFQFDSADLRGVFSNRGTIDGELNEDVASNGDNYPANAFRNAFTGSLVLNVNGNEIHQIALGTTLDATASSNASGSQISVSAVGFSTTTDDIPDYTKPYRTGTYQVAATEQLIGWNYLRLIHRVGGSDQVTNYVQWVVDNDSNALGSASVAISNFNHPTAYYQSGIGYFASRPSGSYTYNATNVYRNTYSNSSTAVQFPTTTNCSISNIRMTGSGIATFDSSVASAGLPNLNNTSDCEQQVIQVTGTVLFDSLTSISGGLGLFTDHDVTVNSSIDHPLKSNLATTSLSKQAFMVYSGSIGSTTLTNNEYFNTETYRIVSGNYDNQAALTSSTNVWNSQTAMNNGGTHDDGLASTNGYVLSPFKIGNAGDTRNAADGGSLQAPAGNPNYSTLTNNTRTFYRRFQYTGVSTVASFTMTIYGDATLVGKAGTYAAALGANKNCFVEVKIPFDPNFPGADDQSTAFADAARIFESGNQPNNEGAGIRAGSFSGEDQTIDGGGLALSLTLGTRRIKQNQHFIVKISAHKDWTGYISRIQVAY